MEADYRRTQTTAQGSGTLCSVPLYILELPTRNTLMDIYMSLRVSLQVPRYQSVALPADTRAPEAGQVAWQPLPPI